MTRLVVTTEADADVDQILEYLEREAGSRIADKYEHLFHLATKRLIDIPEAGAPRPILGPNARIVVVSPYVFVYDYTRENDTATLLRILHGRRNIALNLLSRS